jgi:sulfate transport system ATP-binding protein
MNLMRDTMIGSDDANRGPAARSDATTTSARPKGVPLTLRGLGKRYGPTRALDGIDLDVAAGELVALLGPSGSGKTTLLRVVAGLLAPDHGQLLFGHADATALSLRERNVGFVFQHYALFRHMTVADNIAFGLRSRPRRNRPGRAVIDRRVQELLSLIQLSEYGGRFPEQLSGGQKQRVALARALAIDPTVLLLDEPFGALDAKVRTELRQWLRRLHERTGQTTLFVTHDQEEALELADRIVVMRNGCIEQVGLPAEIYDNPASAYVFDFVGRSCVIEGDTLNGQFIAHGQMVAFPIGSPYPRGLDAARMHVRPHDLRLAAPDAGYRGRVVGTQRRADRIALQIALAGQPHNLEIEIPATVDANIPTAGAEVGLEPMRYRVFARSQG